jgi:hypothetical protein
LPQPDLDLYDADDSQAPPTPGEDHEPEPKRSENA